MQVIRQQNKLNYTFIPLPMSLARTPEVIRHVVPSAEFAALVALQANIMRISPHEVKAGAGSWQAAVAQMYEEDGILATHASWEKLAEWCGMSERHVQRLVKRLVAAKLLQTEKFGDGYIFYLGDGDNITFLEKFSELSREEIIASLTSSSIITDVRRDEVLTNLEDTLGFEAVEKVMDFEENYVEFPVRMKRVFTQKRRLKTTRKYTKPKNRIKTPDYTVLDNENQQYSNNPKCQMGTKKTHRVVLNLPPDDVPLTPSTTQNLDAEKRPIIDKGIDKSKTILTFSPETEGVQVTKKSSMSASPLFTQSEEKVSPGVSALSRISGEASWVEAEKAARDALRHNITLRDVNAELAKRLPTPYNSRFANMPRTGHRFWRLDTFEDVPKDHNTLSAIMRSIAEDITGANHGESSSFYTEVRGALKTHVLAVYSWEQIIWTIRRALRNPRTVDFLSKGGRNIIPVIKQFSKEYHEFHQERVQRYKRQQMEQRAEELRAERAEEEEKELARKVEEGRKMLEENPHMAMRHEMRLAKARAIREAEERMKEIRRAGLKGVRSDGQQSRD